MLKTREELISKLLMLIMCTIFVSTTIAFSGITNVVYASAATVSAESDFSFDASTGTITKYVGSGGVVVIPNTINGVSVTSIGDRAFSYSYNIMGMMFYNNSCKNLTDITIPNSVKSIGQYAFEGCENLTSVTIPNSVTSIEEGAFTGCYGLTSITIPNSVTSIEDYTFDTCRNLTNITIPNSVTSIGQCAFLRCYGLKSITIPTGVTSIGQCAFEYCSNLANVAISNSVTSIGQYAFDSCNSLTNITIPTGVRSIGDCAFSSCRSITSITIPNGVTSIGKGAFSSCSSLTSITIPNSVTSIGDCAFSSCNSLKSIIVDTNNYNYISVDGILFNKSKTKIIKYPAAKEDKSYIIPSSVTSIEIVAFEGNKNLTSVTIPNSVTRVGQYAFSSCSSLTSIAIPNSVANIDEGAFAGCSSLTSVTIPNSVTSIAKYAFYGCDNAIFYVNSSTVKQLLINSGVDPSAIILTYSTAVPANPTCISSGYNSIKTSWSAVTGASGYEVYRSTSSTGTYSLVSNTTSTSFTDTGLTTATPYYYKIRAYTTVGTTKYFSNYTVVLNAKPVLAVPANSTCISAGYNSIKTSWSAVTGASGYEVYRSTSSTGTYSLVSNTTYTSFTDTGLTTATTYYYKVRTYRTVGTTKYFSNYTAVLSAKPVLAVPANPTCISAGYNSIKTSWNAVTGASGYEVYRATSSTGTYSLVTNTTSTSYTNTGLTTGTAYYYKVGAYRTVGATKYYSNYTTVLSAKPVPATPANFAATRLSSASIKLTWSIVSGSSGYELYRSTASTGTYSLIKTTTDSYYANTSLTNGTTYYYKARAYRIVGTAKVYSNWTTIKYAKP